MPDPVITSMQNPKVKRVVRLRKRGTRDDEGLFLIEGYRELKRALENNVQPVTLFYAPELFQGTNEHALIEQCRAIETETLACTPSVFTKMAYRDRPEGLLALAPQSRRTLADLRLPPNPLLLIAEHIEKPGNLGTMLRSADAAGVDAVIVCDRCTDIHNPNVVRASIGTLFALPVVDAGTDEVRTWLRQNHIQVIAATPHTDRLYTALDYTKGTAILVGAEQVGLSDYWMQHADGQVRIPMLGQCDSLNVAAAATILLYEAVRQRLPQTTGDHT
jgi:RNA methyltransferase, TrmH family